MRRHELSDEQWALVAGLMPRPSATGGGRWRGHRQIVNGLLWKLRTGAQWRDLPARYGPWQTVYDRFSRWRRDGTFDRPPDRLRLHLGAEGRIDLDTWRVDGASIRASRSAAGAPRKPPRASRKTTRWAARGAGAGSRPSCTC
jgi:transposase